MHPSIILAPSQGSLLDPNRKFYTKKVDGTEQEEENKKAKQT